MEPSTTFNTDYTAVAYNAAANTSTVADNTANTSDTSAAADNTADTSEVAGNTPDTSAVADKHCFVARSVVLQSWLKGWWFAEHQIHAKDLKPETFLEMETLWFSGARKLAIVSAPEDEHGYHAGVRRDETSEHDKVRRNMRRGEISEHKDETQAC